jgi:hypothetical protein
MLTLKSCAKCKVKRQLFDFAKDANRKDGLQPYCKACNRAYRQAKRVEIAAYREASRVEHRERNAAWRKANPDRVKAGNAKSYHENKDANIKRVRAWQQANPDKHCEIQVRRYASIKSSQPAWANREAIARVYKTAAEMRKSGSDVHVDHIVPLRSKFVCGLHVPANLQIIDCRENVIKNNRLWPDMP